MASTQPSPLNRDDVKALLQALTDGVPPHTISTITVNGGAAMVLRGERANTGDIDLRLGVAGSKEFTAVKAKDEHVTRLAVERSRLKAAMRKAPKLHQKRTGRVLPDNVINDDIDDDYMMPDLICFDDAHSFTLAGEDGRIVHVMVPTTESLIATKLKHAQSPKGHRDIDALLTTAGIIDKGQAAVTDYLLDIAVSHFKPGRVLMGPRAYLASKYGTSVITEQAPVEPPMRRDDYRRSLMAQIGMSSQPVAE